MFNADRQAVIRRQRVAAPESVIEIGSTGVRLLVAEFFPDGKQNILDRSDKPLPIGKDVFTSGSISQETQNQLIQILVRYREQLEGWELRLLNVPALPFLPSAMQKTVTLLWTVFLYRPVFMSA